MTRPMHNHECGMYGDIKIFPGTAAPDLADEVAIMYAGQIVEVGPARDFFPSPLHPYSRMLMDSVPRLRSDSDPIFITGQPPSLVNLPSGCRFAERCPKRIEQCTQEPEVVRLNGRVVKCWLYS